MMVMMTAMMTVGPLGGLTSFGTHQHDTEGQQNTRASPKTQAVLSHHKPAFAMFINLNPKAVSKPAIWRCAMSLQAADAALLPYPDLGIGSA
jgi:hypothetical protein